MTTKYHTRQGYKKRAGMEIPALTLKNIYIIKKNPKFVS